MVDALRPLGVRDMEMPCTPERVWRAVQAAASGAAAPEAAAAAPGTGVGAATRAAGNETTGGRS